MRRRLLPALAPFLGILLFVVALLVLRNRLQSYSLSHIWSAVRNIPPSHLLIAVLLTAVNYLMLTTYDALGFFFLQHRLPFRKIVVAAFAGHALANSTGFSIFTCGSVRYRFYSSHGFSMVQILRIVAFSTLTFVLGFSTVASLVLLIIPPPLPPVSALPIASLRPIGALLMLFVLGYLALCARFGGTTITLRGRQLGIPPLALSLLQIAVACTEWLIGAAIILVLLPSPSINYLSFLAIYLLAQILGVLSQVPGGFGVLESIIIALLPATLNIPVVIASLLVYRIIFNVLPLIAAITILAGKEIGHGIEHARSVIARSTSLLRRHLPHPHKHPTSM